MVNRQQAAASLYRAWEMDPTLYDEFRRQFLAYAREFVKDPAAARIEITSGAGNQVNFAGRSTMTKLEHQQILGAVLRHIEAEVPPSSRANVLFRPS